jgi:signal transduction histidine kinase
MAHPPTPRREPSGPSEPTTLRSWLLGLLPHPESHWPLTLLSMVIVLVAGAFILGATAVLGVVRFDALPESVVHSQVVEGAKTDFLASLALVGSLSLLFAAVTAFVSVRAVAGDLQFVTRRVRAIAQQGDLGEPVAVRALDEVGALTRAFEALRQSYIEQLDAEQKAHRDALEADKYKSEFLTTVSHELRTPLNSMLGFSDVLLAEIEGPLTDGQREDLRLIRASAEHLLALFNNVLDFSALSSGRVALLREPVDVRALLKEVAALLEAQRQDKPVAVVVDTPRALPPLEGDPTRLRQILLNLGTNALKFTARGEVRLGARVVNGRELSLSVRDTGVGISAADLPQLFEEFTQVGAHEFARRGSGLGLSIVQKLVRLHGGRVDVVSEEGTGSTFTVTLPLPKQAAAK